MASITSLSIRRPVATAMVYLILIVVGFVSFRSLPVDLLPSVEFTQLTVRVRYPNVGPAEIEQIITDPIENVVSGLPNLERVTSQSEEGSSRVRLEFARGTNIDEAANDLRAALDRLRDQLPVEAEPPEIFKLDLDRIEVISMAATSTYDLEELTRILERDLARQFEQIPGVGAIETRGGIYREIRIEVDRDRLAATGLTALDIQEAIRRENITLPGGNVKSGFSDLYVRSQGEYDSVEQIGRVVITSANGYPIRVRDVARVHDGYEDVRYLSEINGVPSVGLGIQKQSGANTVEVARRIRREVERINETQDDIHLSIYSDQSEFIQQSIDNVRNSALWGSLFAILVLYLFLRNRSSTAIIALSIPISVIATFGLLYFGGLTLNQMTFGGLALGVGLIVDNGIVVLESIVRKREEEGESEFYSAEHGTREVAGAIVASTLTTCVIFVPVVFTQTTSGALFQALALVVVFALACSLLVALTLVPMLASRFLHLRENEKHQNRMAKLESWYVRRLNLAVAHRKMVFVVTGVLLALAIFLWPLIPVELAPQSHSDEIDVEIEMAQGTNIAVMHEYIEELELMVRDVLDPNDVEYFTVETRGGDAEVELKLVPEAQRDFSSEELADKIRERVAGQIPGAEVDVDPRSGLWILRRVFSSGGSEEEIELELKGWDLETADSVAAEIRNRMERVEGVRDVRLSRREGQPEQRIVFDRERIASLGLTVGEIARIIQANVGGLRAGEYREGGEEFPIVVRLAPEDRLTGDDLRNISLRTPEGEFVPLSAVIDRERGRGPLEIDRVDGQRVTYVTASLESGVALGDAVERIRASLADLELPPDFAISFGGAYEEQQRAKRDFTIAILMALALVYMLMAAQFERFVDPLIVMVSVPIALIGVVPALLLTSTTLNLQSVMGLVMLIGIVVNNAIVLVDAINLLRRERNMNVNDAVIEAGRLRLRPILMTATTTVLGLFPLALGIGTGAEIQAALARVVIGGLIASTLVTLVLIPVTYTTVTGWLLRWKKDEDWTDAEA
ncbi:MAG: efflux RND transporter permease subunit, partial [Thermoanaerobaculia bacterium]|nr:efflux RND transporter permease subunit [Thermoanaerobaculia bacterium]